LKLGIIGGSFDPIHFGHLIIAEYARVSLSLDKLIFIPTGIHPLKSNRKISQPNLRMEMISLAIKSNPYFDLSSLEVDRAIISYTVDTLSLLKEEYGSYELYFIIGTDILFEIDRWKEFRELPRLCKLVLFHRAGDKEQEIEKRIEELRLGHGLEFVRLESPKIEISSTEIRNRLRKGQSIKYLLPEEVENFITHHRLYMEEK